jgi:hypothetical protein
LDTSEKPSADDLRVGLQQAKARTMTIHGDLVLAKIRECSVKFHVPRERLIRGSHQRIIHVVAKPG